MLVLEPMQDPAFVKYDFNKPEDIPAYLHHTFDCVVIDPVRCAQHARRHAGSIWYHKLPITTR